MDFRKPFSACSEFLYASSRAGGAAARDLSRLEAAWLARRTGGGRVVCDPVSHHLVRAELALHGGRSSALAGGHFLRLTARRHRGDSLCGDPYRRKNPSQRIALGDRCIVIYRDLFFQHLVRHHHFRSGYYRSARTTHFSETISRKQRSRIIA